MKRREQKRLEREARKAEANLHRGSGALIDTAAISGAIAGAVAGAVAGPPGVVAGGIVGTAVGVLAGIGLDNAERVHDERDKELDDDIGVTSGDLGAASPDAPPSIRGAFSGASVGFSGGGGSTPSEGPMPGSKGS